MPSLHSKFIKKIKSVAKKALPIKKKKDSKSGAGKENSYRTVFKTQVFHEDKDKVYYFTQRTNQIRSFSSSLDYEDTEVRKRVVRGLLFSYLDSNGSYYCCKHSKESTDLTEIFYLFLEPTNIHNRFSKSVPCLSQMLSKIKIPMISPSDTIGVKHKKVFITDRRFLKYIPLTGKMDNVFQKSNLDERAFRNWLDMYALYMNSQDDELISRLIPVTSTDDSLLGYNEIRRVHARSFCLKDACSHSRFEQNEEYLHIASELYPRSKNTIKFYGLASCQKSYMLECKSELLLQCLRSFFQPYYNTFLDWVTDEKFNFLIEKSLETMQYLGESINVHVGNGKALLLIPHEGAKFLRHNQLAMLDTISRIMEIEQFELLVLVPR